MRNKLAVATALISFSLSPSTLLASEFDWIARNFERESGCKQVHIPFFGLARFVVGVTHPEGVSDLHLAIFEDSAISPERFRSLVDDAVGGSWKPMIRVHSSRGDTTSIYAREDGKHMRFLIGTLDGNDATLVQIRMNVNKLVNFIDEQRNRHRH